MLFLLSDFIICWIIQASKASGVDVRLLGKEVCFYFSFLLVPPTDSFPLASGTKICIASLQS